MPLICLSPHRDDSLCIANHQPSPPKPVTSLITQCSLYVAFHSLNACRHYLNRSSSQSHGTQRLLQPTSADLADAAAGRRSAL